MIQENHEDSLYFFLKSGHIDKVQLDTSKNARRVGENNNTEKKFWDQIDSELIVELNQDWSYKHDLNLFNFSIMDYLSNLS